ncbi:MAG: SLC13 family permease [Gammaproteobacteria bacterium]
MPSAVPFPATPNPHALAVMLLTVVALYLFTRERIPLETSSLLVVALLAAGFELFPYATASGVVHADVFFHGFGHEALVAVCGLMVMGQGLVRTGALEPVGRHLARLWGSSPKLSFGLTLVIAGLLSAFVNNTPIVVLLLPILTSVSLRTGSSSSGVLLPVGLATLVGGMSTSIGTSTNLLVVSVAASQGLQRFGVFDFFLPAMIAFGVGVVYLWLVAPRLQPEREMPLADTSPRVFDAQLHVAEDSDANGKTLSELIKSTDGELRVKRIRRGQNTFIVPLPDVSLRAGDVLMISDTPSRLRELQSSTGTTLYSGDEPVDDEHPLRADGQQTAEVAVTRGSPMDGATLKSLRFEEQHQVIALALHRAGKAIEAARGQITDRMLTAGDVLLVQGAREHIAALKRHSDLMVLDATNDIPHTEKAMLALGIMAAVVVLAAVGVLSIAVGAVAGALVMLLTGCLDWRGVTEGLSTAVILIVVASLALGSALMETGGTEFLTHAFLALSSGAPPAVLLSGLMLMMAVLTNIVSNNATAVIGTPIAIGIAQELGLPPEPFVLAVLFGANMSYATPMAYKTNLLVMSAGGYRFVDFVRTGAPLTFLMLLCLSFVLPRLYGF